VKDRGGHQDETQVPGHPEAGIENTNEASITVGENQRVFFFNKAVEEIFGYSRKEVSGHDIDVCLQHLIIHLPQADFDFFRQISHRHKMLTARNKGGY
jgi:PAS domain S-box-containing protein